MTSHAKAGIEVEIKLGLRRAGDLPRLLEALPSPRHVLVQANHYFDTARGALSAARIMLRVREERIQGATTGTAVAAAKRRKRRQSRARFEAEEIEHELSPEVWQAVAKGTTNLAELDNPVVNWVRAEVAPVDTLMVLGVVHNVRTVIPYEGFTLEVDRTTFQDGTVDVEVEVETLDVDGARAVVQRVATGAGVPLFEQTKGKHRRFRDRLGH